jgi:hypothetical protein
MRQQPQIGTFLMSSAVFLASLSLAVPSSIAQNPFPNPAKVVIVNQFYSSVPDVPGPVAWNAFSTALLKSGAFVVATQNPAAAQYAFEGIVSEAKNQAKPGIKDMLKGFLVVGEEQSGLRLDVRVLDIRTGVLIDSVGVTSFELNKNADKITMADVGALIGGFTASRKQGSDSSVSKAGNAAGKASKESMDEALAGCVVEAVNRIASRSEQYQTIAAGVTPRGPSPNQNQFPQSLPPQAATSQPPYGNPSMGYPPSAPPPSAAMPPGYPSTQPSSYGYPSMAPVPGQYPMPQELGYPPMAGSAPGYPSNQPPSYGYPSTVFPPNQPSVPQEYGYPQAGYPPQQPPQGWNQPPPGYNQPPQGYPQPYGAYGYPPYQGPSGPSQGAPGQQASPGTPGYNQPGFPPMAPPMNQYPPPQGYASQPPPESQGIPPYGGQPGYPPYQGGAPGYPQAGYPSVPPGNTGVSYPVMPQAPGPPQGQAPPQAPPPGWR